MSLVTRMLNELDRLVWVLAPHVPFSALNTLLRTLDSGGRSILDVGCGSGGPMKFINRGKAHIAVGADIYLPSLKLANQEGLYDMLVLCDLRKLPFRSKSVDIVICLQTLEHFEKEAGLRLIEEMQRIARKQVVITTPIGDWQQPPSDTNPHDEHKYIWKPKELRKLGYTVRGAGFRGFGGSTGLVGRIPRWALPLAYLGWILVGPLAYYDPAIAGSVVCNQRLS